MGALHGWFPLCHRLAAPGTKPGIGRKILATLGALHEHEHMVSAVRTKFGISGDGLAAVRTVGLVGCTGFPFLKGVCKHGRHHQPQPHAHTGAGFTAVFRRLFHGHGRLQLGQAVEIVKEGQPALVVNRFLYFGGRSDRVDIELLKSQPKTAEIFLQPFCQSIG